MRNPMDEGVGNNGVDSEEDRRDIDDLHNNS